jgi:UPF0755 protein
VVVVLIVLAALSVEAMVIPPRNFSEKVIIKIENGETLSDVAHQLKDKGIVRSVFWFKNLVRLRRGEKQLVTGFYLFDRPESAVSISKRVVAGQYNLAPARITLPEGTSVKEMAAMIKDKIPQFDDKKFLKLALPKEGYLFPDTYTFDAVVTPEQAVAVMENNFNEQIKTIDAEIKKSGKSLSDIITMASILEEEARLLNTKRVISGILWQRLKIGMPLQVDATFRYINGKGTDQLSLADLTIDSPYNTYRYKGLPKGPITNPGLNSILAAVTPIKTSYLYFLSDDQGNMHYARTFGEHVFNKQKYLD